jgi:GNAT superfamily N-acetyltransferase
MEPITVRPAHAADLADLEADVTALFAEDSGTREPAISQLWPRRHAREWLENHLSSEGQVLLVARAGEHAGYLAGVLQEADDMRTVRVAVLVSMYIRPGLRGRGAGGALVGAFREWARAEGAERLSVTAYTANTGALRFYARHGFSAYETRLKADVR